MWDAWAAYDQSGVADAYFHREHYVSSNPAAERSEAISYAAFRVLRSRYANATGAQTTLARLDDEMLALGYDPSIVSLEGDSAAVVGNRIAATVLAQTIDDGSNEANNYTDPSYSPVNAPLVVKLAGTVLVDPNRWQPLSLDFFLTQNGIVQPIAVQTAIGLRWGDVRPFAFQLVGNYPPPPPQLDGIGDDIYRAAFVDLIAKSSMLTPDDGVYIDASPATRGNNPLGTNDGNGYAVNPITGAPYEPDIVPRGDWARVLAEFWADGPHSETPPGHWNVIANYVSDHTGEKRLGGVGPILDDLEWDVKLYFALNAATHDAAVGCWGTKRYYDAIRPISAIRYMAGLGQSSDVSRPNYHPSGLPLVPGLIELITAETASLGGRHEHLAQFEGELAIRSWPGEPSDPTAEYSGVRWVRGKKWVPYQKATFVTPAFPGYTSGHSTFSRSAAEVLTGFTGSPFFPNGLSEFVAEQGEYLTFEFGPSERVVLQWATYYDAADEAGLSRLFGGIHPYFDDFGGRLMGAHIGQSAYALASRYFAGTAD